MDGSGIPFQAVAYPPGFQSTERRPSYQGLFPPSRGRPLETAWDEDVADSPVPSVPILDAPPKGFQHRRRNSDASRAFQGSPLQPSRSARVGGVADSPPPSVSILEAPPRESPLRRRHSDASRPSFPPHVRGRSPTVIHGGIPTPSPSPIASDSMLNVPPRVVHLQRRGSDASSTQGRSRSFSPAVASGTTLVFHNCHVTYRESPAKLITDFGKGQPYYVAPGLPSPPLSGSGSVDNGVSGLDGILEGLHDVSLLSDVLDESPVQPHGPSPRLPAYNTPIPSWSKFPLTQQHRGSPLVPHHARSHSAQPSPSTFLAAPSRTPDMQRSRSESVTNPPSILKNSPYHRPRSYSYGNPTMTPQKSPGHVRWKDQLKEDPPIGTEVREASPTPSLLFPKDYAIDPMVQEMMQEEVDYHARLGIERRKEIPLPDIDATPAPPGRSEAPDVETFRQHDWKMQSWTQGPCMAQCGFMDSYMKCRGCERYMCVMCYNKYVGAFVTPLDVPSLCSGNP